MEYVDLEVQAAKESYELGEGAVDLVLALMELLKDDGKITVGEWPELFRAVTAKFLPSLQGADKIIAEYGEDKAAVVAAFGYHAARLAKALGKA